MMDQASVHTKLDIARYYDTIAERALPYLYARLLALVRAPDGIAGELFFQKHSERARIPGIEELPVDLYPGPKTLLVANTVVTRYCRSSIEFKRQAPARRGQSHSHGERGSAQSYYSICVLPHWQPQIVSCCWSVDRVCVAGPLSLRLDHPRSGGFQIRTVSLFLVLLPTPVMPPSS
ncbi:hypothetical protein CBA19CS11_32165 [Caballeronia novacaledonica]|uniref:non-homologous end-joining DNA ligase LigD n=1 Tax=Caballeronia novacaledonica TaxID=1544861 RepID=UPI001EE29222|nr:hypothetical protein [Caballeronia novacaledonica]GJH13593.1 hypothetical protein CBA19CS11_32165 [Caballeronia novacaledonica]